VLKSRETRNPDTFPIQPLSLPSFLFSLSGILLFLARNLKTTASIRQCSELHPNKSTLTDLFLDLLDDGRVRKCREVTKLVPFTSRDFAHNPAHDLARTGLWQVVDEDTVGQYQFGFLSKRQQREKRSKNNAHLLGRSKRPNILPNLQRQLLDQLVLLCRIKVVFRLQRHESVDGLSRHLVVHAHGRALGGCGVVDQSGFDFGGRETMAGNVDDVVYAAFDPKVAVGVAGYAVAGEVVAWVWLEVRLEETISSHRHQYWNEKKVEVLRKRTACGHHR
jgi:hypothetical protein